MEIEKKLTALGYELPNPPQPMAAYIGCVRVGNLLFVGGNTGRINGVRKYSGKVGESVTLEQAYEMAANCALNHLAIIKSALGDLDRVAVIYANERLDDDLLATMPNLKWVHFSRAGVNAYITPALNERPIQVTSSIGIHGVALAELGLASIFALATRLPECWEAQKRKEWSPGIVTEQIGGKTLGIIGLGTIGTELARMAKGLGMRVIANKRTPGSKPDFVDELGTPEYLPKLLSQSDFVVMCIPSIPSCERMLGEKEFRSMKKSAFLINLTGGRVPEERALVKALREGWIAGRS